MEEADDFHFSDDDDVDDGEEEASDDHFEHFVVHDGDERLKTEDDRR